MNMELWYCPKCDKPTQNWRTCKTCGTPAIYQRFVLIPVDETGKVQKEKNDTQYGSTEPDPMQ